LVYDGLCKSRLADKPRLLAGIGLVGITGVAYALSHLLSPRAAYIHVGAMMGTMMAANVFMVIIPGQRVMVSAMQEGREPPLAGGRAGSLRSLHNNYFTLPVLFIMVSNHFPHTFGHGESWAILAAIIVIGMGVRHWFNLRGQGVANSWLLPVSALALFALAFVSRPTSLVPDAEGRESVEASEVRAIITRRCTPCHATEPSHPAFAAPPKNVVFEDDGDLARYAGKIHQQAVVSRIMPLGNLTDMTEEERAKLATWYAVGAPLD
jgi:uncharacterized membrane protein